MLSPPPEHHSPTLSQVIRAGYQSLLSSLEILVEDVGKIHPRTNDDDLETQSKRTEPEVSYERQHSLKMQKAHHPIKSLEGIGSPSELPKQNKTVLSQSASTSVPDPTKDKVSLEDSKLPEDSRNPVWPSIEKIEPSTALQQASPFYENITVKPSEEPLENEGTKRSSIKELAPAETPRDVNNNIKSLQNEFILDEQQDKSIDPEFEQYVNRESSEMLIQSKMTTTGEELKQLVDFEPFVMVTEFCTTPNKSRVSRRSKHLKKRRISTETSPKRDEWAPSMVKLKQAERRKKVIENQLSAVKNEIAMLENPQKLHKEPKIKQMIKIADDSNANLKAILFVRRMNNERRQKQQRLRMSWQKQEEEIVGKMSEIQKMGEHYLEKRKLKKAQEVAQRVQEYESQRYAQKGMKPINSVTLNKMKRKTEESMMMPELSKRKEELRRLRNLSERSPQQTVQQYNR